MSRRPGPTVVTALGLALLLGLVAAAASLLMTQGQQSVWTASRDVMVRSWNVDALVLSGQPTPLSDEDRVSAQTVAASYEVMTAASVAHPELGSADDLKGATTTALDPGSNFITISTTGDEPEVADRRAQAVTEAFARVSAQRVLGLAQRLAAHAPTEEIRQRALAVKAAEPVQVYRTTAPTRSGSSMPRAAAAGFVTGLALAAVVVTAWSALAAVRGRRAGAGRSPRPAAGS
ncbi:hypothetical protein [Arsenicicoccus dermatophilus]|uniref:hypothetical protein n=1 Tax=Arsenicicoccus dermatophilus TaxID=1076331 RepID=UPI0039175DAE